MCMCAWARVCMCVVAVTPCCVFAPGGLLVLSSQCYISRPQWGLRGAGDCLFNWLIPPGFQNEGLGGAKQSGRGLTRGEWPRLVCGTVEKQGTGSEV